MAKDYARSLKNARMHYTASVMGLAAAIRAFNAFRKIRHPLQDDEDDALFEASSHIIAATEAIKRAEQALKTI